MLKPARLSFTLSLCLALAAGWGCSSQSGAGAGAGGGGGRGGRGGGAGAVAPAVLGTAVQKDVPVEIGAIGNVEAFSTISVRSQVSGVVVAVGFEEGAFVKPGDVLFKIDPRPYEASLQQAQANLVRDQALLVQAEAQLKRDLAQSDYTRAQADRQQQLVGRGLISKDQSDQATASANAGSAAVDADRAAVESAKATLAAQQAMVDSAKVQLDYTTIKSPIAGRTGNLDVKTGNLTNANSTEMTTITQVDPIYVSFAMPALHLANIKAEMARGPLGVEVSPQGGDGETESGRLTFVDNAVDPATDTIRLKATLQNADHALWPGEFVHVNLLVSTLQNAVVVPSQAVQTGQDGQFIFVVKQDMTVEQRPVTSGQTVANETVITKGIAPGERIVVEGQLRLESGTRVTPADPKTGEAAPSGRGGRGGRGQGGGQGASGQGGQGGGRRGAGGQGADQGGQVAPAGQGQQAAPPAGDAATPGMRRGGNGNGGGSGAGASDASGQGGQRGQGRGRGRRGQNGQGGGQQAPQ